MVRALWSLYKDGELGEEYKDFKVLALFVHNPGLIHTTFKRIITPDDLRDQRLRMPNKTVAAAPQSLGATPVILQVNDVMAAVKNGSLDGIVTNWDNPLPDFDVYIWTDSLPAISAMRGGVCQAYEEAGAIGR